MVLIKTFVLIDVIKQKPIPRIRLVALKREDLLHQDVEYKKYTLKRMRGGAKRVFYWDEEKEEWTSGSLCVTSMDDYLKFVVKPVCLIGYRGFQDIYPFLIETSRGKPFLKYMLYADSLAAFYDILAPGSEKTTKDQRLAGELPWPGVRDGNSFTYSVDNVFRKVVSSKKYSMGDLGVRHNPAMLMFLIVSELSENFVQWVDENNLSLSNNDGPSSKRPRSTYEAPRLTVIACRDDGLAVDKSLGKLIRQKLLTLILTESTQVQNGPQFAGSKVTTKGLRLLPASTETMEWLLARDFGVLDGHKIILKIMVRVYIAEDNAEDALQYLCQQNRDKSELELEKWSFEGQDEDSYLFLAPSKIHEVWGENDEKTLFYKDGTVKAVRVSDTLPVGERNKVSRQSCKE